MSHTMTPAKYAQHLTSHESVKFPDGDHVIVHRSPYGVQVTGFLHGDWIEESWDHHAAQEQARLLAIDAPDSPWQLPPDRARLIGTAIDGASAGEPETDEVPVADSAEDVITRTIPLDGGTAIVEHVDNRAEVTIRMGDRIICGLSLSTGEAQQVGQALARPGGFTVGDYWDMHDQLYPAQRAAGAR